MLMVRTFAARPTRAAANRPRRSARLPSAGRPAWSAPQATSGCSTVHRGDDAIARRPNAARVPPAARRRAASRAAAASSRCHDGFEERLLLGQQPRRACRAGPRASPSSAAARAHRPTFRARGAGRRTAGCRRDRRSLRAETGLRLDAALRERAVDEVAEDRRRNLLQPHHRTGLVEGTARADHLFHQARL